MRADFGPDNHLGHHSETQPAELLRNVEQPEPKRLGLPAQTLRELLLHCHVIDDFAFQRDQFAVDKTPNVLFEKAKLFGKLEIHCLQFLATRRRALLA